MELQVVYAIGSGVPTLALTTIYFCALSQLRKKQQVFNLVEAEEEVFCPSDNMYEITVQNVSNLITIASTLYVDVL